MICPQVAFLFVYLYKKNVVYILLFAILTFPHFPNDTNIFLCVNQAYKSKKYKNIHRNIGAGVFY